jgi:hypothetical protein
LSKIEFIAIKFSGLREFFKISRISLDPFLFSFFLFFFQKEKRQQSFFEKGERKRKGKWICFKTLENVPTAVFS